MNILFAYGFCGLGGVETAILNRCKALRRQGIQASVYFRQFYGDGGVGFANLPHVHVGLNETELSALLQTPFDVICIADYPEFVAFAKVHASDSVLILETHAAITKALGYFHSLAGDRDVDAVVVPSNFNALPIRQSASVTSPIHVLPNAVDTDHFFQRSRLELENRFGALLEKTVVLWVGRFEEEKEPRAFMALARELTARRAGLHFVCLGDAPHDPSYRARIIDEVSAAERANYTFHAAVPYSEMPLWYSLAAVSGGCLVSTSRFESVPMTFIEAMACGCPVASSHVGGVTEIVEDGKTGVLFDVDSRHAAVHAVLGVLAPESERRASIVERGLSRVRERHALDAVGTRFAALLRIVASSRSTVHA